MIALDIETTGLDPWSCGVVAVGALDTDNPDNTFYQECQVRSGVTITQEALDINGFTRQQIMDPDKPTEREVLDNLQTWSQHIDERTLAGHNIHFDLWCLKYIGKQMGGEVPDVVAFPDRIIDDHSLVYASIRKRGKAPPLSDRSRSDLSSSFVWDYVGLPEEPDPHKAIVGAKYSAEAVHRLLYKESLLSEFKAEPIPRYLTAD